MIDDPPGSHYHPQSVNHPLFGKRRNITTKYNKFFKKYTDLIFLFTNDNKTKHKRNFILTENGEGEMTSATTPYKNYIYFSWLI